MRLSPLLLLCVLGTTLACSDADPPATQEEPDGGGLSDVVPDSPITPDTAADTSPAFEPAPNSVVHSFGAYELAPFEEVTPCVIWTLNNEFPLYVNEVILANDGGFHHSNWFVVPDDLYEGEDGYFGCGERGFTELQAAFEGSVLFAQSTQSLMEQQQFRPGAVVKIPANHSVVASAHLLNLSDSTRVTELRMQLGLIHPNEVEAILSPIRLTYTDLNIPAGAESRFSADCEIRPGVGDDSVKIHWVLPHYHYLGNHFRLSVLGGPNDGDAIFELDGFNADANGRAYDPPYDLNGATGIRFTCGYYNPTQSAVGWGIGDQEMCVMLALVEADRMIEGLVNRTDATVEEDGIYFNDGQCLVAGLPLNPNQRMPEEEELEDELYIPPSDGSVSAPLEGTCEDTPSDAEAEGDATLSGLATSIFTPSCAFSSCHGGELSSADLDLQRSDLWEALLEHEGSRRGVPPLVVPGDPDGSYLYQLMSQCEPTAGGSDVPHMPLNAPELLPPEQVARVRDWIAAGALDD